MQAIVGRDTEESGAWQTRLAARMGAVLCFPVGTEAVSLDAEGKDAHSSLLPRIPILPLSSIIQIPPPLAVHESINISTMARTAAITMLWPAHSSKSTQDGPRPFIPHEIVRRLARAITLYPQHVSMLRGRRL